jgi:hypothetical protein
LDSFSRQLLIDAQQADDVRASVFGAVDSVAQVPTPDNSVLSFLLISICRYQTTHNSLTRVDAK